MRTRVYLALLAVWSVRSLGAAGKIAGNPTLSGQAAFADAKSLQPGQLRRITVRDLPPPYTTKSSSNYAHLVPRPPHAWPQAPPGFQVELYVTGLSEPRKIVTASDGDSFVADSGKGEILVFRGRTSDGKPEQTSVFARSLTRPFGMAFYPPGPNARWLYVANTNSLVRFPYQNGDRIARGPAEVLIPHIPSGGHWTRDIAFSPDGKLLFLSIGSVSNVRDPGLNPSENHRANILEYTPGGVFVRVYASGIRNPAGVGVNPDTGEVWCSVNERDGLGDNLVPDYITHVEPGGFYGWPYFYLGPHPDPRLEGRRSELKDKTLVPDVLLQPHNASLAFTFYEGNQFPDEYRGDLFAAEHGSWNRATPAGYEVVRVPLEHGRASGIYEDFLTGFVTPDGAIWGRPVGVAVAADGSLLVTDDGSGSIWRVRYVEKK